MQACPELNFGFLRNQIVGIDAAFTTPYGQRLMVYCDYTASGRCLHFVEKYLANLQRNYANTHTEDDMTGKSMTRLLHSAEERIKSSVNAGPDGRIIAVGTGCTGAINRFQKIIGVDLAPATASILNELMTQHMGSEKLENFKDYLHKHQPVVFIGPYEHHSNELMWREGLSTVVRVDRNEQGDIDLNHLESLLLDPQYQNRLRIGSFSAASNVNGLLSPVEDIARLLHRYDALACFDYAASAPYVKIDMNPDPGPKGGDPSMDAIFVSPHKFIGGPGSMGILVFNKRVYNSALPPSISGGGTVDYVGPTDHDFIADIEEREKAGTPGVLQTLKAALAFMIKDELTVEQIEEREQELLNRAFDKWGNNPNIEILGNQDPAKRVAIVSFIIKDPWGKYLHPKYMTVLLNDLFGVQSRAGCSCAGPYGHALLGIDEATSQRYRKAINEGHYGLKPGWCRVGFHYAMDDVEADYLIDAVDFVASKGYLFMQEYSFSMSVAVWTHQNDPDTEQPVSLDDAIHASMVECNAMDPAIRDHIYRDYLREAEERAQALAETGVKLMPIPEGELGELQFFNIPQH